MLGGLGHKVVDLRGTLPIRAGASPYLVRTAAEMKDLKWLVVHHTDANPWRPSALAIAQYQTSPGAQAAFSEIAYHLYVDGDGTINLLQWLTKCVWANGDGSPEEKKGVGIFNWWTIAACFAGDNPTDAQVQSLACIGAAARYATRINLDIVGHRQVSQDANKQPLTECPGDKMDEWLPLLRQAAGQAAHNYSLLHA